jgi:hypothetical protein
LKQHVAATGGDKLIAGFATLAGELVEGRRTDEAPPRRTDEAPPACQSIIQFPELCGIFPAGPDHVKPP